MRSARRDEGPPGQTDTAQSVDFKASSAHFYRHKIDISLKSTIGGEYQRAFLGATEQTRRGIVWLVALAVGMRRGELCAGSLGPTSTRGRSDHRGALSHPVRAADRDD